MLWIESIAPNPKATWSRHTVKTLTFLWWGFWGLNSMTDYILMEKWVCESPKHSETLLHFCAQKSSFWVCVSSCHRLCKRPQKEPPLLYILCLPCIKHKTGKHAEGYDCSNPQISSQMGNPKTTKIYNLFIFVLVLEPYYSMTIPADYVISHLLLAHRSTLRLRIQQFSWLDRETVRQLQAQAPWHWPRLRVHTEDHLVQATPTSSFRTSCWSLRWNSRKFLMVSFPLRSAPKK